MTHRPAARPRRSCAILLPARWPRRIAASIQFLVAACLLTSGIALAREWEPGFRDLAAWGRDMHLRPVASRDELHLTNRWTRLRFRKDSDRMTYNEVEFRLSDRIAVESGRFRVSQRDIDSLMAPLLAPPKRSVRPIRRIAINAGHGGRDPGNLEGRRMEKTLGGFGSLKVRATIAVSRFDTSLFPSKELGWLLPVKASVRKAEGIGEGDPVAVVLEV